MKRSGRASATSADDGPREALVAAWRTNARVTAYLVENMPAGLWRATIPGHPRKTVGMLAAHLHNSRCQWIRDIGGRHGVAVPAQVAGRTASQRQVLRALPRSSAGMVRLIDLALERGGSIPRAVWQNFPTDLLHFLSYFVAHEAHHRGQICLIARELGSPLPRPVTIGLWQWIVRGREIDARPRTRRKRSPSRQSGT